MKVLVLDDRGDDRRLMRLLLEHSGHTVVEAASGQAALSTVTEQPPDIIITDLVMPGMNGYEFVRRLRGLHAGGDTPVIFCTSSYQEDEVRRLAATCGVRHFLSKPLEPTAIAETIHAALTESSEWAAEDALTIDRWRFDAEQLTLLNDKLTEKVLALESLDAERRRLVEQLMSAHEEERERIADELHDDALQALAAVKMRLSSLHGRLAAPEEQQAVGTMVGAIGEAIDRLRGVLAGLQSLELGHRSLGVALGEYLERIEREDRITTSLSDNLTSEPDLLTRTLLYRASQEILMNVRKHARASRVNVELRETAALYTAAFVDDGDGFTVQEAMRVRPGHIGLPSVQARLEMVKGTLEIDSHPGRGAKVIVSIPRTRPGLGPETHSSRSSNGSDPGSDR